MSTLTKLFYLLLLLLAAPVMAGLPAHADAVWQWSTPVGTGRAFLWVPPDCRHVRAVVVAQNGLGEQGILERDIFRKQMARLGIAEIFIAPPFENWQNADNNDAANEKLNAMLKSLADDSGYDELALAPVIPLGEGVMASFPWNFAAWNPSRTLAVLSVHGDAPQTTHPGNARPNPNWGRRNIDGIPSLLVMAEYEWLDMKVDPATAFLAKHPATPLALLAEPGHGHFGCSDQLVKFLTMFVGKAVEQRLPAKTPPGQPPALKLVDPHDGWLVQRWRVNQPRTVKPAAYALYKGDPADAFWTFDKDMALATQNYFADQPAKQPQLLGLVQDGETVRQSPTPQQVDLKFEPGTNGITFTIGATFLDSVDGGSPNPMRWTAQSPGSALGHARKGGPIVLSCDAGPVVQVKTNTFRVQFNRVNSMPDDRQNDIWLLAQHPGDVHYKSAEQQALLRLPSFDTGAEQHITFDAIPDQKRGGKAVKLHATSDSGRPVDFYVLEGPAEVAGDTLRFTSIPPHAKYPVKVAVVAWQLGVAGEFKNAEPVTREFFVNK